MSRAIIFGFEGALVDEATLRAEVLGEVGREAGLDGAGLEEQAELAAASESWAEAFAISVAGGDAALAARLGARISARYHSLLRERRPRWLPGASEFVAAAARSQLELGLVAATSEELVRELLAEGGFEGCFKVVEATERAGARVEAYGRALRRLNTEPPLPERLIHPHEAVAIEGSAAGVMAAAAAGLETIAIGTASFAASEPDLSAKGYEQLRVSAAGVEKLG